MEVAWRVWDGGGGGHETETEAKLKMRTETKVEARWRWDGDEGEDEDGAGDGTKMGWRGWDGGGREVKVEVTMKMRMKVEIRRWDGRRAAPLTPEASSWVTLPAPGPSTRFILFFFPDFPSFCLRTRATKPTLRR